MNNVIKVILIIIGAISLIFLVFWFYVLMSFDSAFEENYTTQDLIENYKSKKIDIENIKKYIDKIVPINKSVDIEFDENSDFEIFHVIDNGNYDSNWDLEQNSSKVEKLMKKLGWSKNTLKKLKEKLDKAHCISVSNGEPCKIGFQRSGMGLYFYNIFDNPIADSLKTSYNDSCTYILLNNRVVLEYGGGAIGPQCFPKNERERR